MLILIAIFAYIAITVMGLSYIFVEFKNTFKEIEEGSRTVEDFLKWQKKHYDGLMFVCLCPILNIIPACASIYCLLILPIYLKSIRFIKNIKIA